MLSHQFLRDPRTGTWVSFVFIPHLHLLPVLLVRKVVEILQNQHLLVFNPLLVELDWIVASRMLLLHIAETPFLLVYPAAAIAAQGQTLEISEGFC